MKKFLIIGLMLLAMVFAALFLSRRAPQHIADPEVDSMITASLIGTWRDEHRKQRVFVFRADGTGLIGSPGGRWEFSWTFYDNELHIPTGWARKYSFESLENNVLTVSYTSRTAGQMRKYYTTYIFYSEATDLYGEEHWQRYVFAIPSLVLFVAGLALCYFFDDIREFKRKRRKKRLKELKRKNREAR